MNDIIYNTEGPGAFDPEVVKICKAMNCLPGIETFESCCGHGTQPFMIFFRVHPTERNEGLFILTRSVDNRYFKHGFDWDIILTASDMYNDGYLPITYILESKTMGDEAYKQADDLVDNIIDHCNHKNFLKIYELPKIEIDIS